MRCAAVQTIRPDMLRQSDCYLQLPGMVRRSLSNGSRGSLSSRSKGEVYQPRPRPTPCRQTPPAADSSPRSLFLRLGGGRRLAGALSSSSGDTEHAIDSNTLLRAARPVAMQKTDGWRACFLAPEEAKGGVCEVVSQKRARAAPLQ